MIDHLKKVYQSQLVQLLDNIANIYKLIEALADKIYYGVAPPYIAL